MLRKKLPLLWLTSLLLMLSGTLLPQTVSVVPSVTALQPGESSLITVRIDSAQELRAYSIKLSYNHSIVKITAIRRLDFLSNGTSTFFFTRVDSLNNEMLIEEAILGTATQTGSGDFFEIAFTALQQGQSSINFSTCDLRDGSNNAIVPFTHNAVINVGVVSVTTVQSHTSVSRLLGNFPNPCNPSTTIKFSKNNLPATILIYNANGGLVKRSNFVGGAGEFQLDWNGRDEYGNPVSSGVYFVHYQNGYTNAMHKMVLLK